VVHVDVPAKDLPHERQQPRPVDELEEGRIVAKKAQFVDGPAAERGPGSVDSDYQRVQLGLVQCTLDHQKAISFELVEHERDTEQQPRGVP
jgi:hypothetical protein